MDSLDRLLAEVKAEYTGTQPNAEVNQQPTLNLSHSVAPAMTFQLSESDLPTGAIASQELAQLKAEFTEQDRAEAVLQQQQRQAEALQQQQLLHQQQQTLNNRASLWLKNLDPLSDEGLWFEEFASHYSSKLEAALDYLQTVQSNS